MKCLWVITLIICITVCSCVGLLDPISNQQSNYAFTEPRSVVVDATGVKTIRVNAVTGFLKIKGLPDISEVRVEGTAGVSNKELLEEVKLHAHREEDVIILAVELSNVTGHASLDLNIEMPDTVDLEVEDTSGQIQIKYIRSLRLKDSSGGIEIENISADLHIEDGSGYIDVNHIGGNVRLKDGSGYMSVQDVNGDVVVVSDGSGDIAISEVKGNVLIHEDGSGDIFASNVRGDFIVERDGSGNTSYSNIGGKIQLP